MSSTLDTGSGRAITRRALLGGAAAVSAGAAATLLLPASAAQAANKQISYSYQAQQTNFWCAAAAARIAISARVSNPPTQSALADRMGLQDPIGLLDTAHLLEALNHFTPNSPYRFYQDTSYSRFDQRVKHNIDHGHALVYNTYYFTGSDGTMVYAHGHYITIVGYDDANDEYQIADTANTIGDGRWIEKPTVWSWRKSGRYFALPLGSGGGGGGGGATPDAAWPILQRPQNNNNVRIAQRLLVHRGASIEIDSSFGQATETAVLSFQANNDLTKDGVIGTNTWEKLIVTVGASGSGVTRSGQAVRAAQSGLNKWGASLALDGVFASATAQAARSFQSAHGLAVDGIVGRNTWSFLL